MRKVRLDQHLVNLGLVESRNRAQRAIANAIADHLEGLAQPAAMRAAAE